MGETEADGRFSIPVDPTLIGEPGFPLLEPWDPDLFSVSLPDRPDQRSAIAAGGSVRNLTLVVRMAARILLRVVREDGMPVPGARVRILAPGEHRETEASEDPRMPPPEETGADGFLHVRGLDPREEIRIAATLGPWSSAVTDVRGRLSSGETLSLDLTLTGLRREWYVEQEGRLVAGVVVDAAGKPVPGASIGGNWIRNLAGGSSDPVSQEDGRFEALLCERSGDDEVCEVRKEGYGTTVLRDRADPVQDLRVVLRASAAVEGRIRTQDGEVVPGAAIEVTDEPEAEFPATAHWERFRSDENGAFRIPDLDAEGGRFLLVRAEGFEREVLPMRGRLVEGAAIRWDPVLRASTDD